MYLLIGSSLSAPRTASLSGKGDSRALSHSCPWLAPPPEPGQLHSAGADVIIQSYYEAQNLFSPLRPHSLEKFCVKVT